MHNAVDPGKVVVEVNGAGHQRGEVQQEMRHHHHICLEAHDAAGPGQIWIQHILLDGFGELLAQQRGIPELEDHGIEVWMRGIVHVMDFLGGFFRAQFGVRRLCFGFACLILAGVGGCMIISCEAHTIRALVVQSINHQFVRHRQLRIVVCGGVHAGQMDGRGTGFPVDLAWFRTGMQLPLTFKRYRRG